MLSEATVIAWIMGVKLFMSCGAGSHGPFIMFPGQSGGITESVSLCHLKSGTHLYVKCLFCKASCMTCCFGLAQITKILGMNCHHLCIKVTCTGVTYSLTCSVPFLRCQLVIQLALQTFAACAIGLVLSLCPCIWRVSLVTVTVA